MTRVLVASVLMAMGYTVSAASAVEPPTASGFTQPSERRTLAFESPGIIAKVLVKEGQQVKAGEVLAEQERRMDQKELEVRRIDAESNVEIDSATKELELRKVQYERKTNAGDEGFSKSEMDEARMTMELAELKVKEAEAKKAQAKAVFERQGIKVELMQLVSQIDGVVEKISVDAGEMADPQKPEGSISVVKNDPLWVEIPLLKTWQAAKLNELMASSPQTTLQVRYLIDKPDAWRPAKVILVAPVADARSGTQLVRLEMPNPEKRSSGLDVEVKLPPELLNDPTAPSTERTAANN